MSGSEIKLTTEKAKQLYHDMLLVRRFEEKSAQLYQMGHIAGFLHLYIGQEAIAAGFNFLAQKEDVHITAYRCHGHALLQGKIHPNAVMAELTGRVAGSSKGKGGSMHIYSKENKFYGGNGIVGGQIPLGTGGAFAQKYKNSTGVSFAYMGDGALPQGQVYEAFNMASLWKLPIVYIIENNQYAMGTPLDKTNASQELHLRGLQFGIPGIKIDGMSVLEVIKGAKEAIDHVRAGKGPILVECLTYRYRGHSMSDPQKYRTKEEVEEVRKQRDPIEHFAEYAVANKLLTEEQIEEIQDNVKKIVREAEQVALNSEQPSASELYTDVLL